MVEFTSYECAHCQAIEPVLEEVAGMVKPRHGSWPSVDLQARVGVRHYRVDESNWFLTIKLLTCTANRLVARACADSIAPAFC